jgi:phosphatidylserine/phosphatidylglycerophosphate/cardiolipin synthase-like enzyme
MAAEVFMTRAGSVAEVVERLIETTRSAVDAALYRFNHPGLARSLEDAARRGAKVRLVVDQNKYDDDAATRKLLDGDRIPFRPCRGRAGSGSKMHHKFLILDGASVLTGSYNWTLESEEENYDNLVVLREPAQVEIYQREFEALWRKAASDS